MLTDEQDRQIGRINDDLKAGRIDYGEHLIRCLAVLRSKENAKAWLAGFQAGQTRAYAEIRAHAERLSKESQSRVDYDAAQDRR
jgi:hypothetical protein